MRSRVLLLRSQAYQMQGEDGKPVEGLKLAYIADGRATDKPDAKGFKVMTGNAPLAQKAALVAVPGFYDVDFDMGSLKNARGQEVPTLIPTYLSFIGPCDLFGGPVVADAFAETVKK